MIESETDDLDMYAHLPEELDGHADFFFDRKPQVLIAKRLSDPRYENRLPMTLGHEFGHVRFRGPLWRDKRLDANRRPADPEISSKACSRIVIMEFDNSAISSLCLDSARCASGLFSNSARDSNSLGVIMDQETQSKSPKLGWTFEELARSLSVSVPFLRLEVKRGRLKAAHLGRRVVLL
ncbi:MAG TPA: hypothetical protein VGI36_19275, partial [Candidatus Binataceae bacterium]